MKKLIVVGMLALLALLLAGAAPAASDNALPAGGLDPATQTLVETRQDDIFSEVCIGILLAIILDSGQHEAHIGLTNLRMLCGTLLRPGSSQVMPQPGDIVTITGPDPWVDVSGPLMPDGSLTAVGQGTVAGRQNVTVKFEGTLGPGSALTLSGAYTMGLNGELNGVPVTYSVIGHALLQGDVDCDGIAGIQDMIKQTTSIAGLPYTQEEPCPDIGEDIDSLWGDDDCNGALAVPDAINIGLYVAGLPVPQTEPCPDIGTEVLVPSAQ